MNKITSSNFQGTTSTANTKQIVGRSQDNNAMVTAQKAIEGSQPQITALALRKRRFNHVRGADPQDRQPLPGSLKHRLLSWLDNYHVTTRLTANAFWGVRLALFKDPGPRFRNDVDKVLTEQCGTEYLAKTLHAISPAVAKWVQEALIGLNLYKSLNLFFENEHYSFHTFVDVLLPVIFVNMSNNIIENTNIEPGETFNVTLADLLSLACEIVEDHQATINARYDDICGIRDPEQRDKKLCQLFQPMVEDFLSVALPQGIDELPVYNYLGFSRSYYETSLKKEIIPKLFIWVHRQLVLPLKENKKDILAARPGGESLVHLAEMAGEKAAEILPLLVADSRVEIDERGYADIEGSPIVGALVKAFMSLLKGSDRNINRLGGWFAGQMAAIGKNSDQPIHHMWKFMSGYAEPLLVHVFEHMSRLPSKSAPPKGHLPDVLGMMMIRFFSITSTFFNRHHKTIRDRIESLKGLDVRLETDTVLLEIFKPYAKDLLEAMGVDKPEKVPLPDFIKGKFADAVKEFAPGFLLKQYFAIMDNEIDDGITRNKLRSLIFNPSSLDDPMINSHVMHALYAQGSQPGGDLFSSFFHELWNESGTERIAKTLERMCDKLSEDIYAAVMSNYGVSAQVMLKETVNPFMGNMGDYFRKMIASALLEILVNITEKLELKNPQEGPNHPRCLAAAHVMLQLVRIINEGLSGIHLKLRLVKEKYQGNSEKMGQEATQAFAGVAAELHDFFGVNPFRLLPFSGLPVGDTLKDLLWKSVRESFLPQMSHRVFRRMTDWEKDLEKSYKELAECYHTTHPSWACRVVAQFATDFIKHYLTTCNDDAAKLLYSSLGNYLTMPAVGGGTVDDPELKALFEEFMSHNLKAFAKDQDPSMVDMWNVITPYIESIVAKFLAEFSKTILEVEQQNPDFMVDVAIQILKDTTEHFALSTRAAEEAGEDYAYMVKPTEMFAVYGDRLHSGVPLDPSASEEEKNKTRLEGCFIPLSDKLLHLANLTVKDLPIPSAFRELLGNVLLKKVMPLAIMQAYKKALEPQVRDALMLTFVRTLYTALRVEQPVGLKVPIEEIVTKPGPKTKHLYDTCGVLVKELIKLVPDTTVQYVFMKERVQNMSAEAIGDALMPYLSQNTLLQLMDKVIYVGLPYFHPSKWEGKIGRQALVPRKATLRPDGTTELKVDTQFRFNFSADSLDLEAQRKVQQEEAATVRVQLKDQFTKTISHQLYTKAWEIVKALWVQLQGHLNDFIEGIFPDVGPKLKAFIDKVFRVIFFDVVGSVIMFLTSPLVKAFKYIIESTVIRGKADDVIKNIQSDAVENLFYKWTDAVIDTLLKMQNDIKNGALTEANG